MLLSHKKNTSQHADHDQLMKIVDSVRFIVRTLRNSARDSEQKLGISSAQLYVLNELQNERSLSINQLAERTYTHQSSVSMVVAKLVVSRLVNRSATREDARKAAISLTAAGRAMLRKSPESGQERLVHALKGMSRSDLRALSSSLEMLTARLNDDGAELPVQKRRGLIQA